MLLAPGDPIRRARGCVAALSLMFISLTGSSATAALISATATYASADDGFFDTVIITAEFDSAGITGVGTEVAQATSLVFDFSKLGFIQSPRAIVLQSPPCVQGTFLAQYTDGAFDAIVSEGGGGGFAQAASRVDPTRINLIKEYIVMGFRAEIGSLSELFEFSGLARTYELDLSVTPYALTEIPEPGTGALLVLGAPGEVCDRPGVTPGEIDPRRRQHIQQIAATTPVVRSVRGDDEHRGLRSPGGGMGLPCCSSITTGAVDEIRLRTVWGGLRCAVECRVSRVRWCEGFASGRSVRLTVWLDRVTPHGDRNSGNA